MLVLLDVASTIGPLFFPSGNEMLALAAAYASSGIS